MQGYATLELLRQMLIEHRQAVVEQIAELTHNLKKIDYKIDHYNTTCNIRSDPEDEMAPSSF
jgi:DNA-binding transcriptional MerR regulator